MDNSFPVDADDQQSLMAEDIFAGAADGGGAGAEMLFFGIDPGLTGACLVVGHTGQHDVVDLPTLPILMSVGPKALVQRKIDGRAH